MGLSPAQRLFGRRTRNTLTTSQTQLKPDAPDPGSVRKGLQDRKVKQTLYYNQLAKELPELQTADKVRIQSFGLNKSWKKGVVVDKADIHSYAVRTEDGRTIRRNRKHLVRAKDDFVAYSSASSSDVVLPHKVTTAVINTAQNNNSSAKKSAEQAHIPVEMVSKP